MNSIIDLLKAGESTNVTTLIEKALNRKVKTALTEERAVVMEKVYGTDEMSEEGK